MEQQKQSLLEKADALFATVTENTEPFSSLSLLDICLKWYNKIKLEASENNDADLFFYCEEKINKVTSLRSQIQSKYPI